VVIAHLPALLLQRQKGSVLRRHLKCMRWGLPMKEGNTLRHARAETVKTKVTFKNLLHHQRCLILCDGFYMCNWRLKKYHPKRPLYYFRLSSTYYPMALAALYRERDGETSFVLLSVSTQNKPYAFIGDRVPCALDYNSWDTWIG
jgi:putative SOS response-associated peptidase YedK